MKSKPIVYVQGAERMVTRARLTRKGLIVAFADEQEGLIPYSDLRLRGIPERVILPGPDVIEVHLLDGRRVNVGCDLARQHADSRGRSADRRDQWGDRGRALGERIGALRTMMGVSQRRLSELSGIDRVTIARIESGAQSPRYDTLRALADALGRPVERLIAPFTPRG